MENEINSLLNGQAKFPSYLEKNDNGFTISPVSTSVFRWNVFWLGIVLSPLIYVFYYAGVIKIFFPLNILFTGIGFNIVGGLFMSIKDWRHQNKVTFDLIEQEIVVNNISKVLSSLIKTRKFSFTNIEKFFAKKISQADQKAGYVFGLKLIKGPNFYSKNVSLMFLDNFETSKKLISFLDSINEYSTSK